MENIDIAFESFEKLLQEIQEYENTIFSEQDTRVKIIDRVFFEVLGWPLSELTTEVRSGKKYLDYKFTISGYARLIVEAKRDGKDFKLDARKNGSSYLLKGPVFKNENVLEGILQAIEYCGMKNAELACVTNGHEWVVFRGSRIGDGRDTLEGVAFVFTSLESVKDKFRLFYDLLSYESVNRYNFRVLFQEAEGQPIRSHLFSRSIQDPNFKTLLECSDLAADLDKIMISFFRQLSGDEDPDLLKKCFITTKESKLADSRLIRISEELVGKVKSLETKRADGLTRIVKRVFETQRNEFVVLIGLKGSGKSTFIDRFFSTVLPPEIAEHCVVIKIDLRKSDGDEQKIVDWLNENLLKTTEGVLFKDSGPSYEDLQGMFYDEYSRWRDASYRYLYEKDKEEFKIEFGRHIEKIRSETPHLYLCRLIGNIVKSRKKVPCLVFDNADHFSIDFQEKVFQYARSIYENEMCLIITPITDKTSWQLTRQGALQSFHSELLYLPVPSPKKVLEKRIKYLEEQISQTKRGKSGNYFFSRGISLNIKGLEHFVIQLQNVFLGTGNASMWLGNLANRDIRRCLDLARDIMTSPYLDVPELYKAYVTKTSVGITESIIKKAVIKGKYNIYPLGQHQYVQNIYALNTEVETTPFLGLRILQLLKDAQFGDVEGKQSYITIDQILNYFNAMLIERRVVMLWLDCMLKSGLCFGHDPTIKNINETKKVEISPCGLQHYLWGLNDKTYILAMLDITPILDRDAFIKIDELYKKASPQQTWKQKISFFISYLLKEDSLYCSLPDHKAYEGQKKLIKNLESWNSKLK